MAAKRAAKKKTNAAKKSPAKAKSSETKVVTAASVGITGYWLMKSEPDVYSIDDMKAEGTGMWEGVRNYQARNFMRAMKVGDKALFYHSNATPPGVVGIVEVAKEAYVDPTQLDPKSKYFDKKKPDEPRWDCVDVRFVEKFGSTVSLAALKDEPALQEMLVVQKGSRLSITPVLKKHFDKVLKMAR